MGGRKMKPRIMNVVGVVAFAVLAGMPAASAVGSEVAAQGEQRAAVSYVVEGDSYSTGTGATGLNGFVQRYRERTGDVLDRPVRIKQEAIGGRTSTELVDYLRSTPEARTELASADVVTVYIGYNDLHRARSAYRPGGCGGRGGQLCYRAMMRRFEQSYPKVLDLVLQAAPENAVVLTGTIPYPDIRRDRRSSAVGGRPDAQVHAAFVEELNSRIKKAAKKRDVPVAGVHERFNGPDGRASPIQRGLIAADRIHPSDKGHRVIAGLFGDLGYPGPANRSGK